MTLDGIPLTKTNDREYRSGEQDRTACMYRLILCLHSPQNKSMNATV